MGTGHVYRASDMGWGQDAVSVNEDERVFVMGSLRCAGIKSRNRSRTYHGSGAVDGATCTRLPRLFFCPSHLVSFRRTTFADGPPGLAGCTMIDRSSIGNT